MNNINTKKMLARFAQAWEDRDLDGVMDCFCDNSIYSPSVASRPHAQWVGKAEIRAGIVRMFDYDKNAKNETRNLRVDGNFACWEWLYTLPDGRVIHGCDFFSIQDGLIQKKDAYRKWTDPQQK